MALQSWIHSFFLLLSRRQGKLFLCTSPHVYLNPPTKPILTKARAFCLKIHSSKHLFIVTEPLLKHCQTTTVQIKRKNKRLSQLASHNMNLSTRSREQALPRLLGLPVELKLEIISHLPHDEYPSRACLRRTHSSFLQLIPKTDIRSKLSDTQLSDQLLKTELEYPYLFPPDHYPCFFCARVLPMDAFVDTVSNRSAHGPFPPHRCCCDCRMLKCSSYRRSFMESFIWIGCTLDELPTPPSRPRLPLRRATAASLRSDELNQRLRSLEERAQNLRATKASILLSASVEPQM